MESPLKLHEFDISNKIFPKSPLLSVLLQSKAMAIVAKKSSNGALTPAFERVQKVLPSSLPKEHVLVKITRTSICQTDRRVLAGQKESSIDQSLMALGHEGGGVVLASRVGSPLIPGQKVVFRPHYTCMQCQHCLVGNTNLCKRMRHMGIHIQGTFSPYICIPEACCYPLADDFADDLMPLIEPLSCVIRAWAALEKVMKDLTITKKAMLIYGAGPMGVLAALWGKRRYRNLRINLVDPNPIRRKAVLASTGLRVQPKIRAKHELSFVANSHFSSYQESVRNSHGKAYVMAFSGINSKDLASDGQRKALALYECIHREEGIVALSNCPPQSSVTMLGSSGYNLENLCTAIEHLGSQGSYYGQVQNARIYTLQSKVLWQDGRTIACKEGVMMELLKADELMQLSPFQARILKLLIRM